MEVHEKRNQGRAKSNCLIANILKAISELGLQITPALAHGFKRGVSSCNSTISSTLPNNF